jgi:hypothetical protein
MGPGLVVVGGVGAEHLLPMSTTEYEHPIQALGPDRTDPPLRERVRSWGADRGPDDPYAFGAEDLIERTGELRIPVPDHEPDASKPLPHREVAGLLGHPRRVWVLGDTQDVYAPGTDMDREQHIQSPKPDRLHSEEVQRQDAVGL